MKYARDGWETKPQRDRTDREAEALMARQEAPPCICRGDGWISAGCKHHRVVQSFASANRWVNGDLWVSLDVPYTYVYDRRGDRQRVVQFRAAGTMAPNGLSFTKTGRLLATPGCYLFDPRSPADRNR